MDDILKRLEERDIAAWADAYSCRARGAEAAARIRELKTELAAREVRGVRVKPLVWRVHRDPKDTSEARTQIGSWTVWEINGSAYCHGPNDTCGKPCEGGINGAKAAAQADYERRILAALEPAPVTPAEAWQPIETAPKDGTVILVYPDFHVTRWENERCYLGAGWIEEWDFLCEGWSTITPPPTHWMPLPEPPRALADAGEAG